VAAQPTGRRDQITDAAAILFNEHGYDQTSMDDIAAAVGIRKPTLYHHVSSKAQILGWIHEAAIAMVYEPLQGYLAQGMAPDEVILAVAKDTFGMFAHNLGYLRIFSENHRNLDPRYVRSSSPNATSTFACWSRCSTRAAGPACSRSRTRG